MAPADADRPAGLDGEMGIGLEIVAYGTSEGAPVSMIRSKSIEIPTWVPRAVAPLAQDLYPDAVALPVEDFGAYASALLRVATDERMRGVWTEVYKREGGAGRGDAAYVHPARPERVRSDPYFSAVEHVSEQPNERDRVQDQAAGLLFLVATRHAVWDRRFEFGPRTRTRAAASVDATTLSKLAARHDDDAAAYDRLGMFQEAQTIRALAASSRHKAEMRWPRSNDPWVVERQSGRLGDDWDRGLIIELAQTCEILFGKRLLATVATIANVVLDRSDITKGQVQGVLKHKPLT